MNVDVGIWPRLSRAVVFLLFVAAVLGVAVWYLPLIHNNENLRKEILRLSRELKKEEEVAHQRESLIRSLRTDGRAVEKLAREKLGFAKPGETVIRFEIPVTNSATLSVPRR